MGYILREFVYLIIMLLHKIKSPNLKVGFRAKATPNSQFEGFNKLSHHSYFDGTMGFASYIGEHSIICAKIGKYCSIAGNVVCLTLTHPTSGFVSTHPCFYSLKMQSGFTYAKKQVFEETPKLEGKPYSVEIGNDVYIGYGVIIVGPRIIGDGAIIAAGSIVTKDVEPYTIVGGTPAKELKKRFSESDIMFLRNSRWWEKDTKWINEHSEAFESVESLKKLMGETNEE